MGKQLKSSRKEGRRSNARRGFKYKLILELAKKGFTIREACRTVEVIFETIIAALRLKDTVETPIGTFSVKTNEKRRGWRFGRVVVFKKSSVEFKFDQGSGPIVNNRPIVYINTAILRHRIQELQTAWEELDDIAKGEAIADLHDAGISYRKLAKCLGKSEGLMRHLEIAGLMDYKLKELVRGNTLSTRSAVLYARETGQMPRRTLGS